MAYPQERFKTTTFSPDSFWERRRETLRTQTLRHQLQMLKDTGRYDAFKLRWHPSYDEPPNVPPVPNHLFWDSDVAKWIEGACYLMKDEGDEDIKIAIDELVDMIADAQQEDGYLNIHFSVVDPKGRFTNLKDLHEMYNAGHLLEAALAHKHRFKNEKFMSTLIKYVNLFDRTFGPDENKRKGYPGHPEFELALARLYSNTGDERYSKLARFFIEERGNATGQHGRHYYDVEADERGESGKEFPAYYPQTRSYWYHQAHLPILEQATITGHSVRAMYLLTATADLVRLARLERRDGDEEFARNYQPALDRLWDNMVEKKMYLTGGIGAMKQWEGFGLDYFLPQSTDEGGCYSETCAAIGVMMLAERALQVSTYDACSKGTPFSGDDWNWTLADEGSNQTRTQLDLNSKYSDIMELCAYNAVLTGMSQDGKEFTYVNQLASSDGDPSKRFGWFSCACCPPNVTRTFATIGSYIWSYAIDEISKSAIINVHMYASATVRFVIGGRTTVAISQTTDWPWDGSVKFDIDISGPAIDLEMRLRIPSWASEYQLHPESPEKHQSKGYLYLKATWLAENKSFDLNIPMKPRFMAPHPFANQPIIAIARGPIVYCAEDVDNTWATGHFKSVLLDTKVAPQEVISTENDKIDDIARTPSVPLPDYHVGLVVPKGAAFLVDQSWKESPAINVPITGSSAALSDRNEKREDLVLIPYYLRANRGGRGMMRVGFRTLESMAAV